jgi:preprotein translocase SecE subunit
MARITTRRPEEDEEDFIADVEGEEDDDEEQISAPPVSDSRRRRKLKRGELLEEPTDTVQPARKDRPTPSQRPETAKSSNPLVRFYQNGVEYFQEVRSELSKVAWLSREDTLRLTYIVLIVTAVSAAFLGLVSFLFGVLVQSLATTSSAVIAGVITIALIVGVSGVWLFRDRLFGGHFE